MANSNTVFTVVDNIQTRIMNSFVNLTKANSTVYPAITTVRYGYSDTELGNTVTAAITSYFVYDQFALRVASLSGFGLQGGLQTAV